jgi:hypothetical protein
LDKVGGKKPVVQARIQRGLGGRTYSAVLRGDTEGLIQIAMNPKVGKAFYTLVTGRAQKNNGMPQPIMEAACIVFVAAAGAPRIFTSTCRIQRARSYKKAVALVAPL